MDFSKGVCVGGVGGGGAGGEGRGMVIPKPK